MNYDVIIIGSGPGGYIAAVRCGQLGLKTAIIEKYPTLGGTCLNVGCIPSKAMLDSTEYYHKAVTDFPEHGIDLKGISPNLAQMVARKNAVVKKVSDGVIYLMNKNKVDIIKGTATIEDKSTVLVTAPDGAVQQLKGSHIIIATGSKPASIPGVEIDKKRIITSTEALNLTEIPKELVVIGGGVIGLEMGSVFARLGTKVSVVEYAGELVANMDSSISKELQRALKETGFDFYLDHKVTSATSDGQRVVVKAQVKSGADVSFEGDYCLVAVGRKPYTEGLGLEKIGVQLDSKGRIEVNERLETTIPGIYAIGDVVRGAMLAHKASDEGVYVAEIIAGQAPHPIDYNLIPNVVYTWPEAAAVGATEEELKQNGIPFKIGKYPFSASARAVAGFESAGMVKVLAHKETDEILGIHMVGPRIADIVAEAVALMVYRASAEDVGMISHAHPTYAEALKEASLVATGNRALNI